MKEDELIYLKYPFSKPKMDLTNRAKIFLPFSALKGFEEKIDEVNQCYTKKIELNEDMILQIVQKLYDYQSILSQNPIICLTYFVEDKSNIDGFYKTEEGILSQIDFEHGFIVLNQKRIQIANIYDIE
ncbi:MAG: hypothetical protein ACI4UK_10525 [Floccifex sp.]